VPWGLAASAAVLAGPAAAIVGERQIVDAERRVAAPVSSIMMLAWLVCPKSEGSHLKTLSDGGGNAVERPV